MKNLAQMMKQAQQMQTKMAEMQEQLAAVEIKGASGAGLVEVTLNGKGDVRAVRIDPSLMSGETEIVEDLIVAAHNDAKAKVERFASEEMKKLTGGIELPPGMKLPF
ncbi:MAG: YbaB/EbfC family nucleoid-associated protein [Alphaproteobacteria bacterium]|nr:YbaB/EbfC family nucleoid-associated protein [Alphaproteobacteria bacterium]